MPFVFLISRSRFFEQGVQRFLGFLHEESFAGLAVGLDGYDIRDCGRMRYPGADAQNNREENSNESD